MIFVTVFLVLTVEAYYLRSDELRTIECGETLNKEEVALLPKNCSFETSNELEMTMVIELWSSEEKEQCDSIKIIDLETKEEQSLCLHSTFDGIGRNYRLETVNLPSTAQISVRYLPRNFVCPGRISQDIQDVKFNITTGDSDMCPFSIYSQGVLSLRLVSHHQEEIQVELRQGRHIRRISMSTGLQTLTRDEPLEIPLYCGIHILMIYGEEITVEAEVIESKKDFFIDRTVNCPL